MSTTQHQDQTRVVETANQEWIPFPAAPGTHFKVVVADAARGHVVLKLRLSPGCVLPPHTHRCDAITYTLSGEWECEGVRMSAHSVAYQPAGSTHTASSDGGAELVVVLDSDNNEFLVNHLSDGSNVLLDITFFKAREGITRQQALALLGAIAKEKR